MIAKQKGGVGATTLARELGVVAAASGQRVVFFDLDPQGTLRGWWNRRTEGQEGDPNPGLATPDPNQIRAALDGLRSARVDLVIVDVPPSLHSFFVGAMRNADLILLPTRPTTDDLDALAGVLDIVEETGKPFAFVITQAPPGKSRLFDDALPVLAQRGKVAPALRLRADFPVSAASGRTVTEAAPKGKAAEEVNELWRYISGDLARIGGKRPSVKAS